MNLQKKRHLRAVEPIPDVAGRPPPHDLDAERVLLSDLMSGTNRIAQVRAIVRAEDFFSLDNKRTYEACCALDDAGVAIDRALVLAHMKSRGDVSADMRSYVREVADETPAAANIEAHAHVVATRSLRRQVIATLQALAAEGYGDVGESETEWLRGVPVELNKITDRIATSTAMTLGAALGISMQRIADTVRGSISGITTGLAELDEATAGLHEGELTLLSGRTGRGKTALAMNVAVAAAGAAPRDDLGNGVLVFSIEMPKDQLAQRTVAAMARVDANRLRHGRWTNDDISKMVGAATELARLPIWIDDDKDVSPDTVRGRARLAASTMLERGAKLRVIVIDYIQLMSGRRLVEQGANRERELEEVSKHLVKIADELQVAMLVLCQLNDDGEIRGSRAIGHNAMGWWDIQREQSKEKKRWAGDHIEPEAVEIEIRKQRHGVSPATARCWFHAPYVLFSDEERL